MYIVYSFNHWEYKHISHFSIFKIAHISPCFYLTVSYILNVRCYLHIKNNYMHAKFFIICINCLDDIFPEVWVVNQETEWVCCCRYCATLAAGLPRATELWVTSTKRLVRRTEHETRGRGCFEWKSRILLDFNIFNLGWWCNTSLK